MSKQKLNIGFTSDYSSQMKSALSGNTRSALLELSLRQQFWGDACD